MWLLLAVVSVAVVALLASWEMETPPDDETWRAFRSGRWQ